MIGLTYQELRKLKPCGEKARAITKLFGGASKWDGHKISAKRAVKVGVGLDDLGWAASAVALADKAVERRLRLWMADCAARVLPIYERAYPNDLRVRGAIVASRQFATGKIDAAARAAARAARAAAGDVEEKWQLDRLVAWLSDPEPKPLALRRVKK